MRLKTFIWIKGSVKYCTNVYNTKMRANIYLTLKMYKAMEHTLSNLIFSFLLWKANNGQQLIHIPQRYLSHLPSYHTADYPRNTVITLRFKRFCHHGEHINASIVHVLQPTWAKLFLANMIRLWLFGKQTLSPTGSSLFTEATMREVCVEYRSPFLLILLFSWLNWVFKSDEDINNFFWDLTQLDFFLWWP